MKEHFKIELDLAKNIPFVLDAVIEIGIGIVLLVRSTTVDSMYYLGVGLVIFGLTQLIRKLKTFHLTDSDLIIKRPLLPFPIAEARFPISSIKEIRFNNIKGRFGGPHLTVISSLKNDDFRIETKTKNIDLFEIELKRLNIKTERNGL
ncbi:hypothetical protein [Marivirga sericea]|nr:hypothetical protein [Marivirga sericea]